MHHATIRHLRTIWQKQYLELSLEQKDKIGFTYLRHIIKLNDEEILAFMNHDEIVDRRVSMIITDDKMANGEYNTFWNVVSEQAPGYYTREDLEFLTSKDANPKLAAWMMICNIDYLPRPSAPIISRLQTCAHAYLLA